jgi:hypothetical protein
LELFPTLRAINLFQSQISNNRESPSHRLVGVLNKLFFLTQQIFNLDEHAEFQVVINDVILQNYDMVKPLHEGLGLKMYG